MFGCPLVQTVQLRDRKNAIMLLNQQPAKPMGAGEHVKGDACRCVPIVVRNYSQQHNTVVGTSGLSKRVGCANDCSCVCHARRQILPTSCRFRSDVRTADLSYLADLPSLCLPFPRGNDKAATPPEADWGGGNYQPALVGGITSTGVYKKP
eukprot:gene7530-biopygen21053